MILEAEADGPSDGRMTLFRHVRRQEQGDFHVTVFSNIIGGEQTASSQTFRNINPSNTDDVIGDFASGSAADVAKAIAAANAAFPAWSRSTPQERYEILKKASDEVLARKEE